MQPRFDVERNWSLIQSLLEDARGTVQWIFIRDGLSTLLIEYAKRMNVDSNLIAQASALMRQPSDSSSHDDHMHVRVYCSIEDRKFGCVDRGPRRWWKKNWKSMNRS